MADTHPQNMGSGPPNSNGGISGRLWRAVTHLPRYAGHLLIRAYQLTFSAFIGRQCRYLPSCSAYMDEAIGLHGLYAGSMMGIARICRCHPLGNYGFDPVPQHLPQGSSWLRPWSYGDWQGPLHCQEVFGAEIFSESDSDPDPDGEPR